MVISPRSRSVSYTHLDVYKRQYLYGAYLLGVKPEKPGRWRQEKRVDCGVRRVSGILKSPQGYMEFGTKRK